MCVCSSVDSIFVTENICVSESDITCVQWGCSDCRCLCVSVSVCVAGDMIYEDVQKEEVPQGPNNGWSSSEFESYDEQSDSEKAASRSKVCV